MKQTFGDKMMKRDSNDLDDDDEFFGDQSSLSDTPLRNGQFGNLSQHETWSKQNAFFNIGYLEAFDGTKEEKLQEGFEAGYRRGINDAMEIGHKLGRLIALSTLKNDHDTKLSVARQVRSFLEKEQQSDPDNLDISKNDTDDKKELRSIIEELDIKLKEIDNPVKR